MGRQRPRGPNDPDPRGAGPWRYDPVRPLSAVDRDTRWVSGARVRTKTGPVSGEHYRRGDVPKNAPLPHYDCWLDQMSLPRVFGTRLDSSRQPPVTSGLTRHALPAGRMHCRLGEGWSRVGRQSGAQQRSPPFAARWRRCRHPGHARHHLRQSPGRPQGCYEPALRISHHVCPTLPRPLR